MAPKTVIATFWIEKCRYPSVDEPLLQRGTGMEDTYPWRKGWCWIIRAPYTRKALAVGRWTGKQPQEMVDGQPTLVLKNIADWRDVVDVVGKK